MAEEREREVKNAAKDLVKTQRRAARWICLRGPNFRIFILDFSRLIPFTFFAGRPRERQRLCTRWAWLRRRRWVSELARKRENCCWLRGSSSRSGSLTSWSRELRWWTAVPNNPPSTLREVVLSLPLLPSCNLACFSPVLKEVQESDQLVVPWKPLTIIQNLVWLSSTNCNFYAKVYSIMTCAGCMYISFQIS